MLDRMKAINKNTYIGYLIVFSPVLVSFISMAAWWNPPHDIADEPDLPRVSDL